MRRINFPLVLLIGVFIAIFLTNFPFTTWFSGWDNLHPEFNFPLNFFRALSSVWQENQGLGTYGGHGYAATLPHTIFLWILSLLVPIMYLRSLFTFICLLAGAVGIFFLVRKLLSDKDKNLADISASLGGIFYMLNYATVQNFYIQLEAFIVHFAALPWLFYSLILYLEKQSPKKLLIFTLVSLITSTQGFIPPLFTVYIVLLGLFLLFYFLGQPGINRFKTSFLLMLLTLFINAYWFFPVANYTFSRSGIYLNAYNNLSSTNDFILKNKKYGNLSDIAILKGFLSETIDAKPDGQIFPIFYNWENHFANFPVRLSGYILFALIVLGSISLLRQKKKYASLFFFAGFLATFTFLATDTPPFSAVSDFLQNIPVFKQAFRITFTKFSISFAFFCAVALGFGIFALLNFFKSRFQGSFEKAKIIIPSGLILFLMFFFSFPIFTGNFLYGRNKITIPNMYFQMFDYFKHQDPQTRIANLPQGWNWGWSIYKWGYSGSGFLWYGLPQSILDRSFDVWGKYNEDYYWQVSYAIFSQKFQLLDSVMDKYQANFIVLDTNISPYLNPHEFLYEEQIKAHLDSDPKFRLVKTFSDPKAEGKIYIYSVNLTHPSKDYVSIFEPGQLKNIGPKYSYTNADYAFQKFGSYYTDPNQKYDIYYPFRSLFTGRRTGELGFDLSEKNNDFVLSTNLPQDIQGSTFSPGPLDLYFQQKTPTVTENANKLVLFFPKVAPFDSYSSSFDQYFLNHKATNCEGSTAPSATLKQEIVSSSTLRFISKDVDNCYSIILDRLSQRYSYIIQSDSKNVAGEPLSFAMINLDSNKADLNYPLPNSQNFVSSYSVEPPMKEFGLGYTVNFQNSSIGHEEVVNDLKGVNIFPLPYNFITQSYFQSPNSVQSPKTMVYYQSFDPGWKAYEVRNNFLSQKFPYIFGKEIKTHFLIDNWANGWDITATDSESIRIVYLPQILETIGFLLLFSTFFGITFYYFKSGRTTIIPEEMSSKFSKPRIDVWVDKLS